MKLYEFDMAPINPNVNGIYYNVNTYEDAIKQYSKNEMLLYDRYDNDTDDYQSDGHFIIGKIKSIDLESRKINVLLDERLQFITPRDYVIGFKLLTSNQQNLEDVDTYYNIDSILYACIINKDFLN